LHAEKLVFFSDAPVEDEKGELLPELTAQEAAELLARGNRLSADTRLYLAHAVEAVRGSVQRAHVITRKLPGALLIELFTHEGSGTMITADKVVKLRPAAIDDAGGILKLIEPLEEDGTLVRRGRELLEREIGCFSVIEHDGVIVGCAALYPFPGARAGELACLAVRPDYRDAGYGERLLRQIETQARAHKLKKLFVLTTRATHWFIERGFAEANITVLPREKKALYNYQRRSKILVKQT
jgi:amino-acid N-acetyltransferase